MVIDVRSEACSSNSVFGSFRCVLLVLRPTTPSWFTALVLESVPVSVGASFLSESIICGSTMNMTIHMLKTLDTRRIQVGFEVVMLRSHQFADSESFKFMILCNGRVHSDIADTVN